MDTCFVSNNNVETLKKVLEPTRLSILRFLSDSKHCFCDIDASIEIASNLLSHHLSVLIDLGLVLQERDGRHTYYSLDEKKKNCIIRLLQIIDGEFLSECS